MHAPRHHSLLAALRFCCDMAYRAYRFRAEKMVERMGPETKVMWVRPLTHEPNSRLSWWLQLEAGFVYKDSDMLDTPPGVWIDITSRFKSCILNYTTLITFNKPQTKIFVNFWHNFLYDQNLAMTSRIQLPKAYKCNTGSGKMCKSCPAPGSRQARAGAHRDGAAWGWLATTDTWICKYIKVYVIISMYIYIYICTYV